LTATPSQRQGTTDDDRCDHQTAQFAAVLPAAGRHLSHGDTAIVIER
jgi:hypothetical protein